MIFHLNRIGEIRVDVAGPVGRLNFQPKLFFKPKSILSQYDKAYVAVVYWKNQRIKFSKGRAFLSQYDKA